MKRTFSQSYTLTAGAMTAFIPYRGNGFGMKLNTGTGFSNALAVNFTSQSNSLGFAAFPTGFTQIFQNDDGSPSFFDGFYIQNTGTETLSFTVIAFNGQSIDNNNMNFSGDLSVIGSGSITGQAAISAVTGGVSLVIAAGTKAIELQVSNSSSAGLIVKDVSNNVLFEMGVGDAVIKPYSGTTIKLFGDGATATVYVGVIA